MSATSQDDRDKTQSLASLTELRPDYVETLVNDLFRIRGQEHDGVELRLIHVTRYPNLAGPDGTFDHMPREPFALLFSGPSDFVLPNGQWELEHDQLGQGSLLLTPVVPKQECGEVGDRCHYEAVIA